jgi:hypothetical protein
MPLRDNPFANLPPQPPESSWSFVDELQTPLHQRPFHWPPRAAKRNEAELGAGVSICNSFPDPEGALESAFADFRVFLRCAAIPELPADAPGAFVIKISQSRSSHKAEYHHLRISARQCCICAADSDGVRRALIWLEELMENAQGPFLPKGSRARTPFIRDRISRCFFGPINRAPKHRDELNDDVNYYPDNYLNRLAHQGVNGLWLSIKLRDTVPSQLIPEFGEGSQRRLDKLRETVRRCARYGIRVFVFCIDPAALPLDSPVLAAHPELKGRIVGNMATFCTSSALGQTYLEEATRALFTAVPGLGGMIVIPVGERLTHCYSLGGNAESCPRCRLRSPEAVLSDTLAAMARGVHSAAPEALLIAWPYGQLIAWGREQSVAAAAQLPPDVVLMHNFETDSSKMQLERERPCWDYWLSHTGPGQLCERASRKAVAKGNRVFAKLQVSCSHEIATVPCIPVPGLLYQKYRAMRQLGMSGAMYCWYMGSYPGLMSQAAGLLANEPFPTSEGAFLRQLAAVRWPRHQQQLVKTWQHFQRGFECFPATHLFQYYGPVNDGLAWPLFLIPRELPLAPSWQLRYLPSGDHINECLASNFTLAEVSRLCDAMARNWQKGCRILSPLRDEYQDDPERLREIGLAEAIGYQLNGAANIIRFYQLRQGLGTGAAGKKTLQSMRDIVLAEIANSERLCALAEQDSRLGFHSEAEGYTYFPAKLRWRIKQLEQLLSSEFVQVARRIARRRPPFPASKLKRHLCYHLDHLPQHACSSQSCKRWLAALAASKASEYGSGYEIIPAPEDSARCSWLASYDDDALLILISCQGKQATQPQQHIELVFEAGLCSTRRIFIFTLNGNTSSKLDDGYLFRDPLPWTVTIKRQDDEWRAAVTIPWQSMGIENAKADTGGKSKSSALPTSIRFALFRHLSLADGRRAVNAWADAQFTKPRLVWSHLNPATDFGIIELH